VPAVRVEVDGLWKKFRKGERHDRLSDLIPAVFRRIAETSVTEDLPAEEFWALKNVSFEVGPGEALGIIGPNGAGKSTALKLLTKILKPTAGRCRITGRTGALIELAAGFHPDLTGRENIFLQGAIMGMRRAEIVRNFSRIVDFAGVGEFIDTPVKRYSSGMNARLGFSIAVHVEPEVLVIDEVLAVGDTAFQERCYRRMADFRREGVAIVFVSHNLSAIRAVCDRVLVLRRGEMQFLGPPTAAFANYSTILQPGDGEQQGTAGHEAVVEIFDASGQRAEVVAVGSEVVLRAAVSLERSTSSLASAIRVRKLDSGEVASFARSADAGQPNCPTEAHDPIDIEWRFKANLAGGHYSVELVLFESDLGETILRLNPAAHFGVADERSTQGSAYLEPSCATVVRRAEKVPR
jgi:lipopolysaccharide transport system ATP-binding protein